LFALISLAFVTFIRNIDPSEWGINGINVIERTQGRLPDALSVYLNCTHITDCNRVGDIDHKSRDSCHLSHDEC